MSLREQAPPRYKAADDIGGIPADKIGGFIRKMCVIAQGRRRVAVAFLRALAVALDLPASAESRTVIQASRR
jgi:hypothetical protein